MKYTGFAPSLPHTLNADYIELQYQLWRNDPQQVTADWQFFFQGFELGRTASIETESGDPRLSKQIGVEKLIRRYREIGHLMSCLDPLAECQLDHPLLILDNFGLDDHDLKSDFHTGDLPLPERAPLTTILELLRATYSRTVGVEYMHLQDPDERKWLRDQMEPCQNRPQLHPAEKIRILDKLLQVQLFENYLNKKYLGQTRFSLEGADVIVPMLDGLTTHMAGKGGREIILGMSHRGRLSVQTCNLEKPFAQVFAEFDNSYDPQTIFGSGDVKYHKGHLAKVTTANDQLVEILLVSNASHLESVNPVVEGIARARQERLGPQGPDRVMPLIMHGDAAFAGQGITAETLNMSQLEGYKTGGTVHIVINNQIGYTTLPQDARSTRYSTDVAKMLMVPIFHVYAEDPETVIHIARLACDYRERFKKDVVIDVMGYRRYGHNEGDEPYFSQPAMYNRIKSRPPLARSYADQLTTEGIVQPSEIDRISEGVNACLEAAYQTAHEQSMVYLKECFYEDCETFNQRSPDPTTDTTVPEKRLNALSRVLTTIPPGFNPHPKLKRLLTRRHDAIEKGADIDWSTAESLAFGSLLTEGIPIRLSGQDCRRGTFSQRHSVWVDQKNETRHFPYNQLGDDQAPFNVYNSLLSEAGVLGFEYGYSLVMLQGLTLWEAQYGDFANNAQSVIDLYLSAGEAKWQVLSGLVLLLPHGYEGQGAEHSSARLERFLQLCGQDNLFVCYPSTPSQYFHLLRRQALSKIRKPLIVMTPKSMLRHPQAVSNLADFTQHRFHLILDAPHQASAIQRVLLCTGKIYYDLVEKQRQLDNEDTAILRIEQLYPFPEKQLAEVALKYKQVNDWRWVQEEPENMGALRFVRPLLAEILGREVANISRPAAASAATGIAAVSKQEQATLLENAFAANP